jgi:PAS domain S-box-containing protein
VEADLRQSERQARALLNAPSDTALLLKPDGTILEINEIGAQNLGVSMTEAIGTNAFDLFGKELAQLRQDKAALAMAMKQAVRWEDERDGRHYANNLYPILDDEGDVASIAVFAVDITEQKRLQEKERETAAAEERRRLARDLHDSVTQTMYSVSIVAEALPRLLDRDVEQAKSSAAALRQMTLGALAEMRTLLFELRPEALEKATLSNLLGQLADILTGQNHIPVDILTEGEPDLPREVKIAFYRVAQEAFSNIAKHAKATQVTANLRSGPESVILTIEDNGRGFVTEGITEDKMGLRIMRERARKIRAELDLESNQGQGTQVKLTWARETTP